MNTESMKTNVATHTLHTEGRTSALIHGVLDVTSFDEQNVTLNTVCGVLMIDGSDLHVHTLDLENGMVQLDGRIDSMIYSETDGADSREKGSFLKKLFR